MQGGGQRKRLSAWERRIVAAVPSDLPPLLKRLREHERDIKKVSAMRDRLIDG
jgi:hypothetical protein